MTTIRISTAGEPLTPEHKATLVDRITGAFAEIEVGNDFPLVRTGFQTLFEALGPDDLWIGTKRAQDASPSGRAALVTIRVMAGPWNPEMKQDLFDRVESALRDVLEMPREGTGSDIWMTFVEVPEGGWGLGGNTVSITDIAGVFTEDRQDRISAYLRKPD